MLEDRVDAGRRLAERLRRMTLRDPVVLALPRGGVPVALEIATALSAPLDLVLVRKIGAPWQPELAVGAVADGATPVSVFNADVLQALGLREADMRDEVDAKLLEIEARRRRYLEGRPRAALTGRSVVVVDDGIATGATTRAALRAVRRAEPAEVVLAVPVAPPETVAALRAEVDEIVCLETPSPFGAISMFYVDFPQLSDAEVIELLKQAPSDDRSGEPAP